MAKFGLLFAGCIDDLNNHPRYNNDIGFSHSVLEKYAFDDIKVLYSDGRQVSFSSRTICSETATYANLEQILQGYKSVVKPEDTFLMMISNHGGDDGINTWGDQVMTHGEFVNLLNQITCTKVILLGQCYGGNILSEYVQNCVLISANGPGHPSYATANRQYDEFIFHFMSFYNGQYPDGTPLNSSNNQLSINAAFQYAKNNDTYKNGINLYRYGTIIEVPQISCYDCMPNDIYI